MKGAVIVQKRERNFEVAHRIEAGEHHIEVSVGSSFSELYWDIPATRFVSEPHRYEDVPEVLRTNGAAWLLDVIPQLARGAALDSADLAALAEMQT
ncbi:hypothetical protein [Phenylobacterium sp.]|uniref:hypothetical protein n=1 Tax=Phenylobacterium sp. TaxID=1871053 RepID=UPI0035B3F66A